MSRVTKATKNIKYAYLGMLITTVFSFVSRTLFVYTIGVSYLGVNGLYTNILSVLSLAELGFGVAMNYSLYKPVAENDIEKIKSLMALYKRAYHWIAFSITIIGFALLPFLPLIIKNPGSITPESLRVYYCVFLFNTVLSYFVSYKFSLLNAMQLNYIQTNITTIFTVLIYVVQMIVLLAFKNFLLYLISTSAVQFAQKVYTHLYFRKHYPILNSGAHKPLTKEERGVISRNIRALAFHKIGEIAVYQTDNILISAFIGIRTVGVISNYTLLVTSVSQFIGIVFAALVSGLGNLIATESSEKQYSVFIVYRFLAFWLYGFASVAFLVLLTPFVTLWIGPNNTIEYHVLLLITINYYITGHRIAVNNFKVAAGVFDADKYIALLQAVVNLVVSVILVRIIGLSGIYVGTIIQSLVATFTRPFIVYQEVFRRSASTYYRDSLLFLIVLIIPYFLLELVKKHFFSDVSVTNFIVLVVLTIIVTNTAILIGLRGRPELKYIMRTIFDRTRA